MNNRSITFKGFQLGLALLFLSGCATSPLTHYPEFKETKKNLGTIAIVADVVLMHDVDGDIDEVVVTESNQLSTEVVEQTRDYLINSGYKVGDIIVCSLGYGIPRDPTGKSDDDRYLVKQSLDDESTTDSFLPPFYVSSQFSATEHQQALAEIFSAIRSVEKTAESPYQVHHLPDALLQNIEADKIMFIGSYARSVDFSKQMGQALLSAVLTLGTVSFAQVSYTDGALAVLDTKTGRIIWSDRKYAQGGTGSPGQVKAHIHQMVKNIPAVDI